MTRPGKAVFEWPVEDHGLTLNTLKREAMGLAAVWLHARHVYADWRRVTFAHNPVTQTIHLAVPTRTPITERVEAPA